MLRAMNRTLVLGAAWIGSAAAAVGLGFLAVSLVGASASPGTQPVGASSTSPGTTATAAPPTVPAPGAPSGEQATVGGTVYASCAGGTPDLASAPAPGWWVEDPSKPAEVEFENGTQKVEIAVHCAEGSPYFVVEGPRADDSGGGSSVPPASAGSTASHTSGREDSSGRDGGGHGSDDPPGDDSSGRGGGGHGSDD
jgi:hypothetical protein